MDPVILKSRMEAFLPTAADPDNRRLGTRSAQKKNGDQEDAQVAKKVPAIGLCISGKSMEEVICDMSCPNCRLSSMVGVMAK